MQHKSSHITNNQKFSQSISYINRKSEPVIDRFGFFYFAGAGTYLIFCLSLCNSSQFKRFNGGAPVVTRFLNSEGGFAGEVYRPALVNDAVLRIVGDLDCVP